MSYTVIARKWRPAKFSELVGQQHVAKTLQNAIIHKRIAHGYIFTGSRGVGKTSVARIFSKALNCPNVENGEPCNTCSSCQSVQNESNLDIIEIDGASNNSVDSIRDLKDNIRFAPISGTYKVYIIDEVHMLSKGAFNALLKTLEEPPEHVIFIFATTEIHKVLPTILSRCQRFDFKRIPLQKIIKRLSFICQKEHIDISSEALLQIAKKADGGMRDSQSILDQLISFCGAKITLEDVYASFGMIRSDILFDFVDCIIKKQTGLIIELIDNIFREGLELVEFISALEEHLRNILVCISVQSTSFIDALKSQKEQYQIQAKHFSETDILRIIDILQQTRSLIKEGQNPKLKLEICLVKICLMEKSIDLDAFLEELKKKSLK